MLVEKDRPTPCQNIAGTIEIGLTIHLDEARPAREGRRSADSHAHQGPGISAHGHLPSLMEPCSFGGNESAPGTRCVASSLSGPLSVLKQYGTAYRASR